MAVRVAIVDQRIEARAECTRDGMDWEESHAEYYTDQGHHRGEYRVLNVKATIALDGQQVGRIELILVDRDVRGVSFHEMCDSESAELVDVAFALFDRDGFTPRLRALAELEDEGDDVGEGILAYISKLRVDAPDPQMDIATEALRQLKALVDGWNLAVYICEGKPHYAAEARALAQRARSRREARENPLTPGEKRALDTAERRCVLRDKAPFLRAGFRVADELRRDYTLLFSTESTWLDTPAAYLDVSMEAAVTQKQALALGGVSNRRGAGINRDLLRKIHAFLAPPPSPNALPEPSGEDAALRETTMNLFSAAGYGGDMDTGPFSAEMARRFQQDCDGRCIRGANVIHCISICPLAAPLVDDWCTMGGPGTIDDRDHTGHTPLMVCAGTIAGMGNRTHRPDLSMLHALVNAGADKSLTNGDGLTALGLYRQQVGAYSDSFNSMGVETENLPRRDPEIEGLLMPLGEPTAADLRAINPHT